jgi:UDP-4-amino-4,6-dideoxy-N-acetyl-beta-L-altrosamine N-acetyltransferase
MVIDDLADRPHVCDLLLDQTFGRRATDYVPLVPDGCRLLCGSQKYALLRPEFAALREYSLKRRAKPVLRELLINMGGVDKDNVTGAVLRALQSRPLPADCSLTVVMGQTAPWLKNVQVLACSMQRPTRVLVGIDNMAQLMADSDLAIGAAGATSWERCCLGLPSIMLVVADNQLEVAKGLEEAGAALLCLSDQGLSKQLAVLLDKLCADVEQITLLSKAAAKVADGTGAGEVLARMETDLSTHKSIRARKMRGGDLETVLRWRNHPEVRKYMLSQHKITMAEHRAWFDCSERDDTRALLVVEEDNLMIGCVVFSNVSCAGTADWSFYADPDSLTGTGRKVCEAALDFAFRELQIHRVAGQVLDFNEASIRTHIRLGFTQEGVLREHHLIDGKHLDVIVFGLLSYEWRERNKLFK